MAISWKFIFCAILAIAPNLALSEECRLLFRESIHDRLAVVEDQVPVDLWLRSHAEGFDLLPEFDQRYIRKTLQNPKLFAYVSDLKGRVGFVERMPRLLDDSGGVFYKFGIPFLVTVRPWQGYRVDVLQKQENPGSTFIHELGHWLTQKLKIRNDVVRLLAERKSLMKKVDFQLEHLPETLFFTGNFWRAMIDLRRQAATPPYRLREKFQDTWDTFHYRYYTSPDEYIAFAIQAYFLTDGLEISLPTGAVLSRESLRQNDPAMFKIIDEKFRASP